MFLGTLSGPFFNHLIGSSSSGFTDLILTGERIKAGKIQKDASSSTKKKPFKKESSAVYSSRRQNRPEHHQAVNAKTCWCSSTSQSTKGRETSKAIHSSQNDLISDSVTVEIGRASCRERV